MKIFPKFKLLLLGFFLILSNALTAQSMIGNLGISGSDNEGNITHLSIGEFAIETKTSSTLMLSQGFQQPDDLFFTKVKENDYFEVINFSIFPNPTNQILKISINNTAIKNLHITISGVLGESLMTKEIFLLQNENVEDSIDLGFLPTGSYFLSFRNSDFGLIESFIVQKN